MTLVAQLRGLAKLTWSPTVVPDEIYRRSAHLQRGSALLSLPAELRLKILRMLLVYWDRDRNTSGEIKGYQPPLSGTPQKCYNLSSQILATCKLLFCEGHEILYRQIRLLIVFEVGQESPRIRTQIGNMSIKPYGTAVESIDGRMFSFCSKFSKFDVKLALTHASGAKFLRFDKTYDALICFLYRLQVILKDKDVHVSFDYGCVREGDFIQGFSRSRAAMPEVSVTMNGGYLVCRGLALVDRPLDYDCVNNWDDDVVFTSSRDYLRRLCSAFQLLRCKSCEFLSSQAEYWSTVAKVVASPEHVVDLPQHFENFMRYHDTIHKAISLQRLRHRDIDTCLRNAEQHAIGVKKALHGWDLQALLKHRAMSLNYLDQAQRLALQAVFADNDEHVQKAQSEIDV